jgi:hypothetical protein
VLWWQTSHERAVMKWRAGFAVAQVPLPAWQLAQ